MMIWSELIAVIFDKYFLCKENMTYWWTGCEIRKKEKTEDDSMRHQSTGV